MNRLGPARPIRGVDLASAEGFTCDACGDEATVEPTDCDDVRFFVWLGLGTYCAGCALSCLSCSRPVEPSEAMMCGICVQAYELTEDGAGRLCWGAKSEAHVENAWAEHMCRALGIEDEPEPAAEPARGGFAELVEREAGR